MLRLLCLANNGNCKGEMKVGSVEGLTSNGCTHEANHHPKLFVERASSLPLTTVEKAQVNLFDAWASSPGICKGATAPAGLNLAIIFEIIKKANLVATP